MHDKLHEYMQAYNNSTHRGILNLTPAEVLSDQHQEDLFNINLEKEEDFKQNIFQIGSTVRKRLKRPLFTKGYKQIWSNRVYMIETIDGVRATLGNKEIVKVHDLQKIFAPEGEEGDVNEVQKVEKSNTVQRAIMREGIDVDNILESRRR